MVELAVLGRIRQGTGFQKYICLHIPFVENYINKKTINNTTNRMGFTRISIINVTSTRLLILL